MSMNMTQTSATNSTQTSSATNSTSSTNSTSTGNQTSTTSNQTSSGNNTSTSGGNTVKASIVSGAASKTTTAFSPNPIEAKVGDTVTWTNNDSQPHTVTSGSNGKPDGKFDSSPNLTNLLAAGKTFSHEFSTAGDYPYFCQLHPNMVGKVSVS